MSTVIKVENISKQYRLGTVGTGSLAHDINRTWHKLRGKEDPYLKIGEANDRSKKGESDYVWALQDINFEVKQGEVLGIIGRNGAGKSTLLKILSRTTTPTTGQIKIKGRVASLLEVGTGFHPELTGRENIFLNGAILGMTRQEIKSKFDEIVDFAGVERYIDTPVKRYSSGMYVRLAFGVAAHLEPEILIVDEVLAVGDAEFQKKALGKMKDVSAKDGRTVLFVSHNMNSLNRLCDRGIQLSNGLISYEGNIQNVVENYLKSSYQVKATERTFEIDNENEVQIFKACIKKNGASILDAPLNTEDQIVIEINYQVNRYIKNLHLAMFLKNSKDEIVLFSDVTDSMEDYLEVAPGRYTVELAIPNPLLNPDIYSVSFGCVNKDTNKSFHQSDALFFELVELKLRRAARPGFANIPIKWDVQPL